jgi:hypothetical protein
MWLNILLNPLVLRWILFCCISSYLGSSSSDYIDVSPIIPDFCRNLLDIVVVLVSFFLDLSQECWVFFCVMICCVTVHTCHWWKWTIPCIMSWLLVVVEYYWSSTSSKSFSDLVLHLCIHLDLLVMQCTGVPGYTVWGYSMAYALLY